MVAKMRISLGHFLPLIHQHRDRVRHFLPGLEQDLFADQLGRQKALRLIGDVVRAESRRDLREQRPQSRRAAHRDFRRCAPTPERIRRNRAAPRYSLQQRQQARLVLQQIDLVQDQNGRRAASSSPGPRPRASASVNSTVASATNSSRSRCSSAARTASIMRLLIAESAL